MANNIKSECLFCSKILDKSISSENKASFRASLKMLLRQLNVEPQVGLELIETCEDCCLLLDSYGKMYRDWKLLELQLHKRIAYISDKIYLADTAPNQEDEIKTWYADIDTFKDFKVVKDSNLNQLRSRIKDGCLKVEEKSFPRVHLERTDKETPRPDTSQTKNSNQMLLLLGWLTSPYTASTISPAFNSEKITPTTNPEAIPGKKVSVTSSPATYSSHPIINLPVHHNTAGISSIHGPQRFRCTMCPTTVTRKHDLLRHLRRKHIKLENSNSSSQSKTGSKPNSAANLAGQNNPVRKFIQKNWRKRGCKCDKCGKRLSHEWSLNKHKVANACQHKKAANVTLDFICQFCNKNFRERKSDLERHIAGSHRFYHENGREFRHLNVTKGEAAGILFCAFCGLKGNSREAMKNHIRNNHAVIGRPKQASI